MNNCPHCQAELSPSEIGKLYAGLRKNRRGGPKKLPKCGCCGYAIRGDYMQDDIFGFKHVGPCPVPR